MKLGCIADDYTGATDLAGLLARSGVRVQLHFGLPAADLPSSAEIEIIALKCRSIAVDAAVESCLQAGRWLRARGASTLYWKYCSTFDSTASGNIGPVAEALLELTGQRQALYCPAFPENGRSVFMGHLFVGDQLLSESSLKDHPLNPMTDANLCRVLAPQVTAPVGLWSRLDQRAGKAMPDARHVIADAVEFSDLEYLIAHTPESVLLTGGSALAMPLPAHLGLVGDQSDPLPQVGTRSLILSGSCSSMTQQQVAYWRAHHPAFQIDPLRPESVQEALNWWHSQSAETPCLIYATDTPDAVRASQAALGGARSWTPHRTGHGRNREGGNGSRCAPFSGRRWRDLGRSDPSTRCASSPGGPGNLPRSSVDLRGRLGPYRIGAQKRKLWWT